MRNFLKQRISFTLEIRDPVTKALGIFQKDLLNFKQRQDIMVFPPYKRSKDIIIQELSICVCNYTCNAVNMSITDMDKIHFSLSRCY